MASMETSLEDMASELSQEELQRTEELFEETPTRSFTEEHPDEMFFEAMGADETLGIGVFIFCHGKCSPRIVRRIPSGIKIMKKNVSKCGVPSPIITYIYRPKSQTPHVIVDELTRSFSPAFETEECQANAWKWATDGVLKKGGVEVPLTSLTCEEFNTTPENTTEHFVYKTYVGNERGHVVLVSFGGRTIDLLRCTMQNILETFGGPSPTHPRYAEIMTILDYINENIGRRGQIEGKSIISTDFVFNMAKYLNFMYGVNIVRILDESCNNGIPSQPHYPDGRPVGYGGKKSKKQKRKRRKSKKLF
jgi:hypothetical protein